MMTQAKRDSNEFTHEEYRQNPKAVSQYAIEHGTAIVKRIDGTVVLSISVPQKELPCWCSERERPDNLARPHIVVGEFQSDKYPSCPRGKVPLSVKDPTAQDLLYEYAERRYKVDREFCFDLQFALKNAGYERPVAAPVPAEPDQKLLEKTCATVDHFRRYNAHVPPEWAINKLELLVRGVRHLTKHLADTTAIRQADAFSCREHIQRIRARHANELAAVREQLHKVTSEHKEGIKYQHSLERELERARDDRKGLDQRLSVVAGERDALSRTNDGLQSDLATARADLAHLVKFNSTTLQGQAIENYTNGYNTAQAEYRHRLQAANECWNSATDAWNRRGKELDALASRLGRLRTATWHALGGHEHVTEAITDDQIIAKLEATS